MSMANPYEDVLASVLKSRKVLRYMRIIAIIGHRKDVTVSEVHSDYYKKYISLEEDEEETKSREDLKRTLRMDLNDMGDKGILEKEQEGGTNHYTITSKGERLQDIATAFVGVEPSSEFIDKFEQTYHRPPSRHEAVTFLERRVSTGELEANGWRPPTEEEREETTEWTMKAASGAALWKILDIEESLEGYDALQSYFDDMEWLIDEIEVFLREIRVQPDSERLPDEERETPQEKVEPIGFIDEEYIASSFDDLEKDKDAYIVEISDEMLIDEINPGSIRELERLMKDAWNDFGDTHLLFHLILPDEHASVAGFERMILDVSSRRADMKAGQKSWEYRLAPAKNLRLY